MRAVIAVFAALLVLPAFGQTVVITTKPMLSGWSPKDFAGTEIQLLGRRGTGGTTV